MGIPFSLAWSVHRTRGWAAAFAPEQALLGDHLFVNRKLLCRLLQLNGKFLRRLADIKVLSVSAEAWGNHLDAHLAVRNTGDLGPSVLVGLEFQPFALLLAFLV